MPVPARTPQLLKWLRDDDVIAFVSVRDPSESIKSAYNWRKHVCETKGRNTKYCPSRFEVLLFDSCYTTLNAFSEGSCDGSLCGEGWDEKNEYVYPFDRRKGRAVPHSCEDVRSMIFEYPVGTYTPPAQGDERAPPAATIRPALTFRQTGHIGMGLAWYFSDIEPRLVREIVQNVHGGVLPGFPELGRLNPLYVVRMSHISEDINILMAHHARRLEFLLTEASHPADRSDLSAAKRVAEREGVKGRRLPTTHSAYPEKSDSYVSAAGEARLRRELRGDYELFDLLVGSQEQRALRPD